MVQVFFILYLPAIFLLVLLGVQSFVPPAIVLRDPAALMGAPFYLGVLSNTGLLFWAGSAGVCLLTYAVLTRDGGDREWRTFFLVSAALTTILMIDDMVMVHDKIMPERLGLPETLAFGVYAILGVAFVVGFRSTILKTEYILLLASLSFFALSVLIDVAESAVLSRIGEIHTSTQTLLEDGAKLLGILGWFVYLIWSSTGRLGDITRIKTGDQRTG